MDNRCARCGKIVQPDKYGFPHIICEDCLTYTERWLRKKREQRIDAGIKNMKKFIVLHTKMHTAIEEYQ